MITTLAKRNGSYLEKKTIWRREHSFSIHSASNEEEEEEEEEEVVIVYVYLSCGLVELVL